MPHIINECCLCGKSIHQYSKVGHGYCQSCKDFILHQWGSVKFDYRVEYLKQRGYKV